MCIRDSGKSWQPLVTPQDARGVRGYAHVIREDAQAPNLLFLGTAAMFLVGGGIIAHGIPWLEHGIKGIAVQSAGVSGVGSVLSALTPVLASLLVGLVAGAIAVALVGLGQKARQALR